MVAKSTVSEFGFLENLASLLRRVSFDSTGFVSRRNLETLALSDLHRGLLAHCNSDYARSYLEGGLRHWSRKWEYPYILGQVAKFVIAGGGARIFDNACGVNATAFMLASAGLDLTGTDLNNQASPEGELPSKAWAHIDTKKFQGSMRFETADSLDLPFSDGEFDASYSISSLEHMPDPVQAVKEMIRVTRPGGLITFTMDVSPLSSPVEGESNVNLTNFSDIQEVLSKKCTFFAPPRFDVPDDVLSWHGSQRDRTALHGLFKLLRRHFFDSKKDRNFYVFCGAYIKL